MFFPQTSIHVMAMRLDVVNKGFLRKKKKRFETASGYTFCTAVSKLVLKAAKLVAHGDQKNSSSELSAEIRLHSEEEVSRCTWQPSFEYCQFAFD